MSGNSLTPSVPPGSPKLGPAMKLLNPRQQTWVMLITRGETPHDATIKAGYSAESDGHIRWQTHALMHNEKVRAAMWEECRATASFMVPGVLRMLHTVAMDTGHKDQVKAGLAIASRGGMPEVSRIEHKVEISVDEKVRKAVEYARELGIPPESIVGEDAVKTIDAEFEEVIDPMQGIPL
jgi:hypothetical protein